ncbi:MAG: hypothetical protein RBR38_06350 [Desulfomicrobium apsheronum]|nr:hypothetical protein [Desulfomicrobium apsheronum]
MPIHIALFAKVLFFEFFFSNPCACQLIWRWVHSLLVTGRSEICAISLRCSVFIVLLADCAEGLDVADEFFVQVVAWHGNHDGLDRREMLGASRQRLEELWGVGGI